MQDVKTEEERDLETRFLDGEPLHLADPFRSPKVEVAADPPRLDSIECHRRRKWSRRGEVGTDHGQLAELLLERHGHEDFPHPCRAPNAGARQVHVDAHLGGLLCGDPCSASHSLGWRDVAWNSSPPPPPEFTICSAGQRLGRRPA
jgi:hypothetical protein